MSESYRIRRKVAAAKERGRQMANVRWQKERQKRDKLARLTAEQHPSKIVLRVIVIREEKDVQEAVVWSFDSRRSAKKKLREIGI